MNVKIALLCNVRPKMITIIFKHFFGEICTFSFWMIKIDSNVILYWKNGIPSRLSRYLWICISFDKEDKNGKFTMLSTLAKPWKIIPHSLAVLNLVIEFPTNKHSLLPKY